MNLSPRASASRPRIACEILPGGVVAGRSTVPGQPFTAVARVDLPEGAVLPSLRPGNIPDRIAVIAGLRRVLENVGGRANARNAEITIVIPDAAVRVLLLDFDALPAKLSEALPIVRFRLKKLVPFDADEAMVSFQIMSTSRTIIRVLAVAIPRDVLAEYETAVREAGFEPGAVLPSTLAALAALDEGEGAALLVNAHPLGVTTAIVRAGILLLHRAVELTESHAPTPANLPAALFEPSGNGSVFPSLEPDLPQGDWAVQTVPETQEVFSTSGAHTFDMYASEAAPVTRSPYASSSLQQELQAQFQDSAYAAPDAIDAEPPASFNSSSSGHSTTYAGETGPPVHVLPLDLQMEETARAVSVAIAYFEDTLAAAPEILLSAGPLGADGLNRILSEQGVAGENGVRVRELLDASALAQPATTAQVPRGWLAGVAGALRS